MSGKLDTYRAVTVTVTWKLKPKNPNRFKIQFIPILKEIKINNKYLMLLVRNYGRRDNWSRRSRRSSDRTREREREGMKVKIVKIAQSLDFEFRGID